MARLLILPLVGSLGIAGCTQPTSVIIEPLRVVNWSPSNGAFCVDVGTQILITFSDDLDAESITPENIILLDSNGPVSTTITYDQQTFTARVDPMGADPVATLDFDRLYSVQVQSAVRGKTV